MRRVLVDDTAATATSRIFVDVLENVGYPLIRAKSAVLAREAVCTLKTVYPKRFVAWRIFRFGVCEPNKKHAR